MNCQETFKHLIEKGYRISSFTEFEDGTSIWYLQDRVITVIDDGHDDLQICISKKPYAEPLFYTYVDRKNDNVSILDPFVECGLKDGGEKNEKN